MPTFSHTGRLEGLSMRNLGCFILVVLAFAVCSGVSEAQDNVGAGSTPQGDIMRGEGVYLKGLGSWELNNAKANAINDETRRKIAEWDIQYYNWLTRLYNAGEERRDQRLKKAADAERQKQLKLRKDPTQQDVQKGDALNVLLYDLSNPRIAPSAWRLAKVPLPDSVSIRRLAFKFADKEGQGSRILGSNVIALGKLDLAGHWPGYLPANRIGAERAAYEAAYARLVKACEKGESVMDEAIALRAEIAKMKARAVEVIPVDARYREYAGRFVGEMSEAAKVFDADTMDFASDFIADSHRHEAETVGDLLAFMRKYRLYFAPAGRNPDTGVAYEALHQLLKRQAEALDLKPGEGVTGLMIPADAKFFDGKRYKIFSEILTWHQARAKCKSMGGHLPIVRNEAENKFIVSLLSETSSSWTWLGATDEQNEGTWVWVDGSPMRYNSWDRSSNQPNNGGEGQDEHYLMVGRRGEWVDLWNQGRGRWIPIYVCQWD